MKTDRPKAEEKLNADQRRLVMDNLSLVPLAVAQLRVRRDSGDMVGAGRLALCRAALRWQDGSLPFAAYAADSIRCELLRCLRRETAEERRRLRVSDLCVEEPGYGRAEERLLLASIQKSLPAIVEAEDLPVARLLLCGRTPGRIAAALRMRTSEVCRAQERIRAAARRWISG